MIKVNLLFDRTAREEDLQRAAVGKKTYKEILSIKTEGFTEPEINPLVKVLLMLVPITLFYFYDQKIHKDANIRVSRITAEVQQTQEIRDQKKSLVTGIESLKAELNVRKPILEEFKKISLEKVHGVKVLDQLQDLIPLEIWISEIEMSRSDIDISGVATSDKELTVLQRNFEDSTYFKNILIYNSIEEKTEKGDSLITFRMKASIVIGGGLVGG